MAADSTTVADLIRRSSEDDALRTELLADPKTVLERALGTTLPADLTVNTVEQSATEYTLVLPPEADQRRPHRRGADRRRRRDRLHGVRRKLLSSRPTSFTAPPTCSTRPDRRTPAMAADPTTLADLIRRSSQDDALRTELLTDPKTVLERELSTTLPTDLTVNAVEQSATELTLVLPPKQASRDLTDDELAGVAGGTWGNTWINGC
jgi:hypothetical protein